MGKKALIIVDVQNDFVEDGALAVQGGRDVATWISEYLVGSRDEYDYVVATQDWHIEPGDHFSATPNMVDTWPEHCVADTDGADFAPELTYHAFDVIIHKGMQAAAYSGFEGTDPSGVSLADWLRIRDVTDVDICGLAYDHCVKATALDALGEDLKTRVLKDLTASVSPGNERNVTKELEDAGAEIVTDDEV